jgi:hypothetical protein
MTTRTLTRSTPLDHMDNRLTPDRSCSETKGPEVSCFVSNTYVQCADLSAGNNFAVGTYEPGMFSVLHLVHLAY